MHEGPGGRRRDWRHARPVGPGVKPGTRKKRHVAGACWREAWLVYGVEQLRGGTGREAGEPSQPMPRTPQAQEPSRLGCVQARETRGRSRC